MPFINSYLPFLHTTGKENIKSLGIPYDPSERIAMEVHPLEPLTHYSMCSIAELAAEAAEDSFLASMISAPLFPTFGLKYVSIH